MMKHGSEILKISMSSRTTFTTVTISNVLQGDNEFEIK